MLNKVNKMQKRFFNLLVFIGLLLSSKSFAQSCDPYIQKALEQTHITTLPRVSYGARAEFVIRYPLNDTKYILTDQDGNTYIYRYSYSQPNDEKITIEIPVGVTTKERRFALKAENGICSYTSGFDYTITPVSSTPHQLSVRVEDEWCDNAAGLFFSVVGQDANNNDYNFYYKKASDAAYPTTPLSALKVEGIGAGTYDIKAVKKTSPHTSLTQQVTIRADKQAIAYTAQYIPALCIGNGSIKVKVTSGKFPLTYTLINADNNTEVRSRQSSNVFLDVPAGNYKVEVRDNCAKGGGNASTQVVVAANQILNFTQIRVDADRPLVHEYSCEYVAFKNLELRGLNIEKVWEADAFPYPFEVKWEFVSPTNRTYYYAKNITNRTDLEQAFKLSSGGDQDGHKFLEWKEHVYQSTPKEFGTWRITAHITACGTTQTLPYVPRVAEDPMKDITFETDNAGGCNPAVKAVRYGYYAPYIPVYYVLERYPAHFDPNAAGFYKIQTSNPDMQDKFVKLWDTRTRTLIPSGLLNVGDKVQFKVVSADCPTRSELYPELTIQTGVTQTPALLYLSQVASCKGVTATGTEYASLRIENMYNRAQLTRIVITDFTGDRSKLPTGMSIPYVVSDSDRIHKDLWIVKDLPAGTYTLKYTDACGYEGQRDDAVISPEAYTLSWSTDCLPKVSGNLAQAPKGNVLYSIERYDTATKSWKPASSNGNPLPILGTNGASEALISGELKGKFRIVRRTFTHTENQDKGPYECTQVLSEKEYKGSLEGLSAVGFGCGAFLPGNPPKYHIALIPKGGHPPYTYTLVTKNGVEVNRSSTDGNFFLNLDPDNLNTRYVFKVRDHCGDERTYDEVISNFLPPQLTTSQEYYCVGQKAILSVPDLGEKVKIEWYRSDNPTHVIHRGTTLEVFPLQEADFTHTYGVRFVAEYDSDVNACIARANISAYQLRKANDYPAFTAPNALSLEKCAPVDTTPEIFDLNSLFINRDSNIGNYNDLQVRIVDKAGVILVPADGKVNINSPEYAGRTNTFIYKVLRPCGEVLVSAEATLKVRKTTASDKVKTQIVICQEDITYAEVAQLILSQSDPAVRQAALAFHWYTSAQDAQNETNEKQASDAVGTIPNGGNKTLYLRVQQNYLCPSAILSITLTRTSTTALAPQNLGAICALTVGELKKRIDATEHNKIILYQNGVALADAYQLSSGTSLTYSKQEGTCLTAQSPVTVTIQPHSVAEPKVIPLCTQYWKDFGFSYVYIGELRAALRALYPSAKANGIKIYDQDKNLQNDGNILRVESSAFFTIEENNKCPSDYYPVSVLEKEHTPARAEALTLCPDATVGTLRASLVAKGYNTGTLNIYKNDALQMNDSDPIDWNMLDKYTFTIAQAPKCPSRHMPLSLERSTNLTPAVARTVALCSTTTPTAGQVKAAIGTSAKLYLQNGNNWDEQADGNAINLSILDKYFYTIQDSGKCVSEKTPLLIAPKPEKPTGVNANQTFCAADQKRVRDLAPQGADLYWYNAPSGGTPLPSGTLLQTATTYYVARANDNCESDREAVNVTITPAPQLTEVSTTPTYVPIGGGSVTLSFKGTPNATVTFKVGAGAEQTIVLDNAGVGQSVQTISSSTVATIEKITMGTCSQILNKKVGIPELISPDVYKYQQSSDQLVCEGTQVTIRLEALFHKTFGFPVDEKQLWVSTDGGANYTEDTTATLAGVKQVDSDPNAPDKFIYTYTFTATEAINNNKYKLKIGGRKGVNVYWVEMEPVTISVQYLKIKTQPVAPAPYCKGATVTPLTVVAEGNDTNYTYQWYKNNTNSTTGATPILGANAASYTPSTDLIGTTYYFVKVANDAGCKTVESNIIPVTVKKSLTITKQPSHATYCQGQTSVTPFEVEATGEGLTYEWFQNTSPIIHGGTSTGVTTDTYTPNTSSTGITYYYCVVKDNCGNEERTIPVRVTINKKTTITAPPVGATYCQNDAVNPLRVVAEGSGTLQYKWYQTSTATNVGGTQVGTDAPNYIPLLTTPGTFYYYVEVIGQCETVRSNSITFVVKQAPALPTLSVEPYNCTENTKVKVTSARTGLTFHAADGSAYTLNGNGEITPTPAVGTHTLRAKNSDGCYSLPVTFVVKGKTAPDKPVLEVHENATCTDKTKIKIVGYDPHLNYHYFLAGTLLNVDANGVITTDLAVGTHKIYAENQGCPSPDSDDFTIESPKKPVTPTLNKVSDPGCTTPTLMKITNISQYSGATYTFVNSQNATVSASVDTDTGAITALPAGTYQLKVTQNGCTSDPSASFTIAEQLPSPVQPTVEAEDVESCDNPSTVKISNVVTTNDVSYIFTNTATNAVVSPAPTVNRTTGVVTGLAAGTYKVTAKKGTCEKASAEFTITAAKGRPAQPTVTQDQAAGCGTVSTAKVTNLSSYASGITFKVTKGGTPVSATVASNGSINGISDPGNYVIKAVQDGCESAGTTFTIDAKKPIPVTPVVSQVSAAGCGTLSTAKVSNYATYPTSTTFTITTAADVPVAGASVAADGTINGITSAGAYKVKAKIGTCTSEANFTIDAALAAPVTPVVSQVSAAGCGTLSTAKVSNYATYPTSTTFTITTTADALVVGASVAADGTINGITTAGTYKVKAKQGTCDSSPVTFTIDAALPMPSTPIVAQVAAAGCGTLSTAKVSNYATYPTGTTFTITTATDAAVAGASVLGDGTISGITSAGAYKVKAKIGTCTSEANFTIDAALAVPAAPTVTLTPASCTSLTVAKISNYVAGQTYWNGTTQLSVNATTHEITGLGVGTYTITTKEAGCESVASSSFEIKAKQAATTTTNPVGATYVKDAIAAPLTVTATGEGVLSYQWFEATSPTATGTAVGSNSPSYTPSTSTVGSKFYYVEVTGSCGTIKSAVAEIKVSSVIDAVDDPEVSVPRTGGTVSILTNDTLNGNPATPSNVTVTIDNDGGLTGLTVDSTGNLVVPNNTTPGTYTITYKICDKANLNVCDTATAKIKVPSVIDAVDDPEVSVPRTGGTVSILTNDTLNGNPATTSNVTVTIDNDGGLAGLTVDSTGNLVVPNNTTPGTYTITYKICDKANLNVCDTATAKIKVPSVIDAVDDPEVSVPRTGGIVSILTNDTLNGNPATPSNVTVTIDNDGGLTGLTVDSTGKLVVPNNTTPGTYTITYKICDRLDANVCDTATAKITVTGTPTTIQANDDGVWEVGTQGEFLTPSILDNDRIGSKIGLSASDVTIEKAQGQPAPDSHLVMNADGRITVKEGIALGTYIYYYTIIDKSNNNQTSSAKAIIKVVSFVAQQDEYSLTNTKDREQNTPSVITNDEMDGKKPPVIGTDVTLTPGTPSHPNLHMNPDGTITIAPNTPDGVYTYDYTICRVSNPTDCKTTQAIINLHPSLVANDDDYSAHPVNVIHQSAVVGNVLDNDTLGGAKITDPTKVAITLIDNDGLSGVSFAPNGEITVPQGANEGTYRVRYNLCMAQQLSVCDDAVVTIVITKDKPLTIYNGVSSNSDGKNDGFTIEGIEAYPKNTLKIFNRWGVLVYEKEGYTNAEPFDGYSNGRSTVEQGKRLPQGTYYYILDYQDSVGQTHNHSGWLYLKKE